MLDGVAEVVSEGVADESNLAGDGAAVTALGLSLLTTVGTALVVGAAELDGDPEG